MARYLFGVLFFCLSLSAQAGEGTGVGVVLGSPNGITARHWITEMNSVEGSAGWGLIDPHFQVNANYLWSQAESFEVGEQLFDTFFGIGLSLRTKSGNQNGEVVFGPRLPVGASFEFTDPNVEVFTQAAINVGLIPSSDIYFDANIGVRFYLF